jgi:hypothetical protein
MHRYFEDFRRAKEAVRSDSVRLLHVKTYELPVQYAAMEIVRIRCLLRVGGLKLRILFTC